MNIGIVEFYLPITSSTVHALFSGDFFSIRYVCLILRFSSWFRFRHIRRRCFVLIAKVSIAIPLDLFLRFSSHGFLCRIFCFTFSATFTYYTIRFNRILRIYWCFRTYRKYIITFWRTKVGKCKWISVMFLLSTTCLIAIKIKPCGIDLL